MAEFTPIRLTDPKGKEGDVVASNAIEYSNFLYRDGFVVSADQSGLVEEAPVVSEQAVVESPSTAAPRAARPEAKSTDATGKTVATA